jgi:hypothetical protein
MARAGRTSPNRRAAELERQRSRIDRRREPDGIDLVYRRRPQDVGTGCLGNRCIRLEISRVRGEVLRGAELHRIDEVGHDDRATGRRAQAHQRSVARVERSHGRDERDRVGDRGVHLSSGTGDDHRHT